MGWGNLPDDWGSYFHTCGRCGQRYHASGTDECACPSHQCGRCGEVGRDCVCPDELEVIGREERVTRKDRWCDCCGDKIRAGTKRVRARVKDEKNDHLFTVDLHTYCEGDYPSQPEEPGDRGDYEPDGDDYDDGRYDDYADYAYDPYR